MVYLIESLGKINSTEIYSTARSNKAVDNIFPINNANKTDERTEILKRCLN